MSKLTEQLNELGIYNVHGVLLKWGERGKTDIVVCYHPRPEGRMGIAQCSKTLIYSPSHKTDAQSHWSDYGRKSFIGRRAESLWKALAWATEKYGIPEWANDPFTPQDRIPKSVLDAMKKTLKTISVNPKPKTL